MDETPIVGSITFSNIANPNTWGLGGDSKALVFSCPSEAKRGEELFTAMQDAAFKAGREAGMREAAGLCQSHEPKDFTTAGIITRAKCAEVILSAIGGGK